MTGRKKSKEELSETQYGGIIFGVGLLVALILPFFKLGTNGTKILFVILVITGLIVGVLNLRSSKSVAFMVSSMVLILLTGPFLGAFSQYIYGGQIFGRIFGNIISLVFPATLVVALKELFLIAKN